MNKMLAEKTLDTQITYSEHPALALQKLVDEIAGLFWDAGYRFSDVFGHRVTRPIGSTIHILAPREPIEKSFLGFTYTKKQLALNVGTLCLDGNLVDYLASTDNKKFRAEYNKQWILDVYGRDNVKPLTGFISRIAEQKKVRVHITLLEEQPRLESRGANHMYD
ncbi:MAG: hypothetical protein HY438_02155 [DPANN group archaeon]|nr:hypothetical protein [DPANN group archaeon]